MIDIDDDAFLDQNIKGMMMTLLVRWNGQMDAARGQTDFAAIRPADMRVFGNLRGRTVKLSDIHREMGFSRQAAQQAIARLADHGMIEVSADPANKRDKVIKITAKGQRWRSLAAAQIRSIEDDITATLGEDGTRSLRAYLAALLATD